MQQQIILIPQGELIFYPNCFSKSEADNFFRVFRDKIQWEQKHIRIFGKKHPQARLTAWYADEGKSYTYSNLKWEPLPWIAELSQIKKEVEKVAQNSFNSVLLNLYRNGSDSMGWHSDDEPELGKNPLIASVSFGEVRRFHLKHKSDRSVRRIRLNLSHGSLLIMAGSTQHFWQHQIPKTKRVVEPRINLTFRTIKG